MWARELRDCIRKSGHGFGFESDATLTNISAAFPYIPGKTDVIEGYPRIQNLLTNKCELVGIQVEALQIWDTLENARSTKSFDLIA